MKLEDMSTQQLMKRIATARKLLDSRQLSLATDVAVRNILETMLDIVESREPVARQEHHGSYQD